MTKTDLIIVANRSTHSASRAISVKNSCWGQSFERRNDVRKIETRDSPPTQKKYKKLGLVVM